MLKGKFFPLRYYTTLTGNSKEYKAIKTQTSKYAFHNNLFIWQEGNEYYYLSMNQK